MNKSSIIAILGLLLLVGSSITQVSARPSGISNVQFGCTCHSGSASSDVTITLTWMWGDTIIPEQPCADDGPKYAANATRTIMVTITGGPNVTNSSVNHGGFNLVASAGTLSAIDNTTQIINGEATHTEFGNDQRSWQVNWTAPSDTSQDITFTAHGNSVNGDGAASSDDKWNREAKGLEGDGCGQRPEIIAQTPGFGIALTILTLAGVASSRVRKNE